ncbi:hypothetical protein B0H14DRAFT_2562840 [Mycena olivaceomarginata]|nr:hypothetical protein B0H14DRAFT_2562840 [Mycena olivaceomarginata]
MSSIPKVWSFTTLSLSSRIASTDMVNVFEKLCLLRTARECGAQISEVKSSVIVTHQAPVRTFRQCLPGIQGSRFKHFDLTNISLHPILLTTRSLAAVFWYFLWLDQILSGSLIESQRNSDITSVHLMGTVPPGKQPFAHRFFYLSILGDKDSEEGVRAGELGTLASCLHACGAPRETALVGAAGVLPLSAIAGPMEPVHLGQWSVMVPPPPRHCWRLTTVTLSHWQMRQRRIGATRGCGTSTELATRRPPAFPAVGREGWIGTGPHYSLTLRLVQCCIGGRAAWALVWCRGAASRQANSGVVAKGRCGTACKAHICWNCRGQYGMCRRRSRGVVVVWSITEALPGVAGCERVYAPHGAGQTVDEHIA